MNRFLMGLATCCAMVLAVAASAQEKANPVDEALLRALIQKTDVVLHRSVKEVKEEKGVLRIFFNSRRTGFRGFRGRLGSGDQDGWTPTVQAGGAAMPEGGKEYLMFFRADPATRRLVLLDDANAAQPANAQTVAQLVAAWETDRRVLLTMAPDKQSYACGEPITFTWKLKNNSPAPVRVYVGQGALFCHYEIGGESRSVVPYRDMPRQEADYVTLAPGAVFTRRQTLSKIMPEGRLRTSMTYMCGNNYLGRSSYRPEKRVEDVFYCRKEERFYLTIAPPNAEMTAALLAILDSGVWANQLPAMEVLANSKTTAALPKVRAMARHPWYRMRMLAVLAVTMNSDPAGDALRDLLYDPNPNVRRMATTWCRTKSVPGSSLLVLAQLAAEYEAWKKGYLPKPPFGQAMVIYHLRDDKLNDVLDACTDRLPQAGYLLGNRVAPAVVRRKSMEKRLPEMDLYNVKVAWQEQRAKAKDLWTVEEFEKEVARCRERAFAGLKLPDNLDEIRKTLKTVRDDYRYKPEEGVAVLEKLGRGIVPATLFILENTREHESESLYLLYIKWQVKEAMPHLLSEMQAGRDRAAAATMQMDPKATLAQAEPVYKEHRVFASILGLSGDRRAVPILIGTLRLNTSFDRDAPHILALTKCTGKTFTRANDWLAWWEAEGKQQTWK